MEVAQYSLISLNRDLKPFPSNPVVDLKSCEPFSFADSLDEAFWNETYESLFASPDKRAR